MIIRPEKTSKIAEGVYAVQSAISNFYIIDAGASLVAFDTGVNKALAQIGMKALGLDPAKVSHVFLTHSDYDHAGGLSLFHNAEVYISKAEEPMVTGKRPRLLMKYNKKIEKYKVLNNRDTVKVGRISVEMISSPGHTPGSVCYLINDDILVSGDTLRTSPNGRLTPFLFFQNMNHGELKRSLHNLRDNGVIARSRLILTGHTGILRKEQGK